MEYIGITDARNRLSSLVDGAQRTVIVRNNQPRAILLPIDDYRSLVLAQARLSDPEHVAKLLERHRAVMAGELEGTVDFSAGGVDELMELVERKAAVTAGI